MQIVRELRPDSESIFYIGSAEQKEAYITFLTKDNVLTIEHTIVSEKLKGQGIGKLLVAEVAKYARETNFKVNSTCWFADGLLQKNEEYEDIRA